MNPLLQRWTGGDLAGTGRDSVHRRALGTLGCCHRDLVLAWTFALGYLQGGLKAERIPDRKKGGVDKKGCGGLSFQGVVKKLVAAAGRTENLFVQFQRL